MHARSSWDSRATLPQSGLGGSFVPPEGTASCLSMWLRHYMQRFFDHKKDCVQLYLCRDGDTHSKGYLWGNLRSPLHLKNHVKPGDSQQHLALVPPIPSLGEMWTMFTSSCGPNGQTKIQFHHSSLQRTNEFIGLPEYG